MSGKQELSDEQRKVVGVEREWRTSDINPQEISDALGGILEPSDDADSKWNIHLYYGRRTPFLTLKLDPEARKVHIAVYGPKRKGFLTYRYSDTFYCIEDLWFVQYHESKSIQLFTDISFRVRTSGRMDEGFIISSHWHRSFECKRCGT